MRSVLTILAGACCASLALAQPGTSSRTDTTTTTSYQRITTVVGTSFMVARESVGKVVDVVFNSSGCIEYLLVQDGEEFIVVPWGVVTVNAEQKVVTVQSTTVTVDKLREVRFAEGRLPNFADPTFTQRMTTVWGSAARRSDTGRPGTGTPPDRKDPGTGTPPDRKDTGTRTPPDRKDPGTKTPPDRKDPGTRTPPDRKDPGTRPPKTDPTVPPKKDKDKDKDGR